MRRTTLISMLAVAIVALFAFHTLDSPGKHRSDSPPGVMIAQNTIAAQPISSTLAPEAIPFSCTHEVGSITATIETERLVRLRPATGSIRNTTAGTNTSYYDRISTITNGRFVVLLA